MVVVVFFVDDVLLLLLFYFCCSYCCFVDVGNVFVAFVDVVDSIDTVVNFMAMVLLCMQFSLMTDVPMKRIISFFEDVAYLFIIILFFVLVLFYFHYALQ